MCLSNTNWRSWNLQMASAMRTNIFFHLFLRALGPHTTGGLSLHVFKELCAMCARRCRKLVNYILTSLSWPISLETCPTPNQNRTYIQFTMPTPTNRYIDAELSHQSSCITCNFHLFVHLKATEKKRREAAAEHLYSQNSYFASNKYSRLCQIITRNVWRKKKSNHKFILLLRIYFYCLTNWIASSIEVWTFSFFFLLTQAIESTMNSN